MNLELFIAKRLRSGDDKQRVSSPSVRIATTGISLGLAVMILAVAIITGFKNEVSEKVTGFGAHIRISNFDSNYSYESQAIKYDSSFVAKLLNSYNIAHVQNYATKPGIVHHKAQMQGLILKGYDHTFDSAFLQKHLKQGHIPYYDPLRRNDSVLISNSIAQLLHIEVGEGIKTYFFKDKIRARAFTVAGIYQTDMAEFDDLFMLCDLRHIQRLNGWENDEISGYEVFVKDFEQLDETAYNTYLLSANHLDDSGSSMISRSIKELYPQIFGWLDIIDINVWIILTLMLLVSGVNMISGVLILIMERSNTIGILKAMGNPDWNIRKVFVYLSGFLVSRGMLWGNVIAVSIALIQQHFALIPLNPENYYLDAVPVDLKLTHLLLLNAGTLVCITAMMLIPSYLITKISPIKSIQFD